ncbi:uncharacterized protein LOC131007156 [Salvia miltiorrhiza]|uniref:uncharacterized protein LOC131007156 n=1 Tax=Salvia miltiorrhiza TaxID=226208 RepID=UPI0025AB5E6C|nr:uncharacterized protein LOC131007156 [Salvia miltiorrhiza]
MNGMDMTYKKWVWHGEGQTSSLSTHDTNRVGQGNTGCSVEEPIDMIHDAYDVYENNPTHFQTLLEDAEKPLYPGCSQFTKLSATIKLYNLKAKHGWSDSSFNDLLKLVKEMLPESNSMPFSLYDAKKTLSTLGLDYDKIHACPNDCILYRKEYLDSSDCPTCGMSRWKVNKKGKAMPGVPSKVMWYFPPIPRFRRMFRTREIAKELVWHADERKRDGKLRHPADAPAWRLVDNKWPDFGNEPRNLRLALATDGMNPHNMMNSNYSCWPVVLVTYNLPPWLCMKRRFMMLTLLISGPKQPGNDIDVYLAPLIDDLKELWEIGIQAYDAHRSQSFTLRSVLLWTINDFPAYGNLSGCSVKGYKACPICADQTHSKWLPYSRKVSYTGHRQFLPESHPYRRQKKAFDGVQELRAAPKPLSGTEVFERMQACNCVWEKTKGRKISDEVNSKKRKKKDKKEQNETKESVGPSVGNSCFKKKSIFYELEYWQYLHVRHILDVMHIEKNVLESLIGTLLDIPGKTKDGVAARMDLVHMGVRNELAPTVVGKKTCLPPACYTLTKEEKRKVCTSFLGMKFPDGYSSNISKLVSMKDLKLSGLKSHDCYVLMQQLLPIAIRGVLPKHVRIAITRLCHFFNDICNKEIDVPRLEVIQKDIVTTLCLLEKYFTPSFFDIMVHLTVHLVREVKLCGPVWYRWMYPFERYMKILKGYVRNRHQPEGCIAESYIVEEAVEYCSEYLANTYTIGIPSSNLKDNLTESSSRATVKVISDEEWEQAHRYVLTNDADIDPYIE